MCITFYGVLIYMILLQVMKVKRIIVIVDKIIEKINVEKINVATSFLLVAFLWAPHGAKSLRGWGMQILFAPPLLALMYLIVRFAKAKYGKLLTIYAVRWTIMYVGVLTYFNFVFWYGPLREYVFPLFVFTSSVFK
jgi:hypothetical protein